MSPVVPVSGELDPSVLQPCLLDLPLLHGSSWELASLVLSLHLLDLSLLDGN